MRISKLFLSGSAAALAIATIAMPGTGFAQETRPAGQEPAACVENTTLQVFLPDPTPVLANELACGSEANADGINSTAIGISASVNGNQTTAIGQSASAQGDNTTAVGQDSFANADNSTAIGQLSSTGSPNGTAIGQGSRAAIGANTTAVGQGAHAYGSGGSAFGQYAWTGRDDYPLFNEDGSPQLDAAGNQIFAITSLVNAEVGKRGTALGSQSQAGGTAANQNNATAAGFQARAIANNATSLGAFSTATGENAVALGQGSIADQADTVSVGRVGFERRIVNVAAGTIAEGSTDAVNGGQLFETNQRVTVLEATATGAQGAAEDAQETADLARTEAAVAQGTANTAIARGDALGAGTAAALGGGSAYSPATGAISAPGYAIGGQSYNSVGGALAAVDNRLGEIDTRVDALELSSGRGFRQANGGIATALALGGTMIVPDSDVSVNFNLATYRGEQGFSGAIAVRAAPRIYVSGGFAGSTVKGSTGGRIGVAFGF